MARMKDVDRKIRWFFEDVEVGPQYVTTFGADMDSAVVFNRHNGEVLKRATLNLDEEKWTASPSTGNIRVETRVDGISYRRVGGELIFVE